MSEKAITDIRFGLKIEIKNIIREIPIYAGRVRPTEYKFDLFVNGKKINKKKVILNASSKSNLKSIVQDIIIKKLKDQLYPTGIF